MKNALTIISIFLILVGTLRLEAQDKYDDLKRFLVEFNGVLQEYISSAEKADSVPELLRALQVCNDKMRPMLPRLKNLNRESPEFSNMPEPPPEIKPEIDRLQAFDRRMIRLKVEKKALFEDERVRMAVEEMEEIFR